MLESETVFLKKEERKNLIEIQTTKINGGKTSE
jgi:hypothetical protein